MICEYLSKWYIVEIHFRNSGLPNTMNADSIFHDLVLNKVIDFRQEYLILELNKFSNHQIRPYVLKKVLHPEYYYQIPDKPEIVLIEKKGITRYVFADEIELNNPDLHSFLLKILSALHLELGKNLEIISCHSQNVYPIYPIVDHENIDLISFGIRPVQLQLQGFELLHYEYHFKNSRFFFANSLHSYKEDASKKILWTNLKKMFNI